MATIQSTLKMNDQMSSTFQSVTKAMHSTLAAMKSVNSGTTGMQSAFNKAQADILAAEKNLKSFGTEANNTAKSMETAKTSSTNFFTSLLQFSVVQKIFGIITGQLDSAIQRFDTLNNYTNVMKNLGVSADEALGSKSRLAEGLKGIPTTLDSAILGVQRLTATNQDVQASTEMFLALNNAILAGGASMGLQQTAMEQMTQAYAKGKPDMMEWRSLQQAMPGQLTQIAKAMDTTVTKLGEDLRSGKVSMNDFMKTVVKLNQEGIEGFDNFETQAKNATKGIQTAIANMKSAVSRGWVSMIEGLNNSLEEAGLPTISEMFINLGNTIETVMTRIGSELIPSVIQGIQELKEQVGGLGALFGSVGTAAENSALQGLNAWDFFMIGFEAVKLGILVAIGSLKVGLLSLKLGFQVAALGAMSAFYGIQTVVEVVVSAVLLLLQELANGFIDNINSMIDAVNVFGAGISRVERATFGDDYASKTINNVSDRADKLQGMSADIADTQAAIADASAENVEAWTSGGQNLLDEIDRRRLDGTSTQQAAGGGRYDYNLLDNLANNVVGNDSTGGKAVKTTTKDKLLSDEDIQLLLDVATRDYKLNYEQITPEITVTFGDVRETADVDLITDRIADKLQEIYDANLEVN